MAALTSLKAKLSVDAEAQRKIVLDTVRQHSCRESLALTAAELASKCRWLDSYAFNRRLPELREKGLVNCSGTKKNGRICFVKQSQCMTWWLI